MKAHGWKRYAAPAAFLLAVTIAVVLVRAGLQSAETKGDAPAATTTSPAKQRTPTTSTKTRTTKRRPKPVGQFTTVEAGDTFSVISRRVGVAVAIIQQLNPKVSSTTLHIGQRIRIK